MNPKTVLAKPSCNEVIEKCDKALEAKNKELQLADIAIKDCQENRGKLTTEVEGLRESNSAWYKNPFIMGAFGIATGIILSQTVFKR